MEKMYMTGANINSISSFNNDYVDRKLKGMKRLIEYLDPAWEEEN